MMKPKRESRSGFLFKNLLRGLLWFSVIIAAFVLAEDYIQENFQPYIAATRKNLFGLYSIFFASEVIFGLVPPEFFMLVFILDRVPLGQYIIHLVVMTAVSYTSGVIGYHIGTNISRSAFLKRIQERYLERYRSQLRLYGGFLVFVGAVTPVPFSAICMLAGSVRYPYKVFLLICIFRVVRFGLYGWMVWSFPNLFS